jgi:hypothetical protein
MATNSSVSAATRHSGMASMSAKRLTRSDLPSITGSAARRRRSPRPSTAVPPYQTSGMRRLRRLAKARGSRYTSGCIAASILHGDDGRQGAASAGLIGVAFRPV